MTAIASVEVMHCDAGWRPWTFVKATERDGLVGWSECTDSHGSPHGIEGVVRDLAPLLVGKDAGAVRRRIWELQSATRQTQGGVVQKALAGIENALLDLKAKRLEVPVYELFGGAVRDDVRVYWSHCGTTRVRAAHHVGEQPVRTTTDVTRLAEEVVARGYTGLKTNVLVLGAEPYVYMPGFNKSAGGPDRNPDADVLGALRETAAAFRAGLPDEFDLIVDLNFNFRPEGYRAAAAALEEFRLAWLELDIYDPGALAELRALIPMALCSGENLYGIREYLPYLERHSMDIVSIDVPWNGFSQAATIAELADAKGLTVTPHNYYSHLATFMSAQLCAVASNVRMLEIDVDDVPWRDELVTATPTVEKGRLRIPTAVGWGADVVEDVLREHPWPTR